MLDERSLRFIAESLVAAKLRRKEEGQKLENLREKYLELRRGLFHILSPRDRIELEKRVEEARIAYCAKWNEIQDDKIFVSYDFDRVVFVCRRDLKGYYCLGLLDDWDMWRDWEKFDEKFRAPLACRYASDLRRILAEQEAERFDKARRKKERRRERAWGKELT